MAEVQIRMVNGILELAERHADAVIAVFSHGDPIRAALAHFAGLPLDLFQRLVISPGSVSMIRLDEFEPRVAAVNHTGDISAWLRENRYSPW